MGRFGNTLSAGWGKETGVTYRASTPGARRGTKRRTDRVQQVQEELVRILLLLVTPRVLQQRLVEKLRIDERSTAAEQLCVQQLQAANDGSR